MTARNSLSPPKNVASKRNAVSLVSPYEDQLPFSRREAAFVCASLFFLGVGAGLSFAFLLR